MNKLYINAENKVIKAIERLNKNFFPRDCNENISYFTHGYLSEPIELLVMAKAHMACAEAVAAAEHEAREQYDRLMSLAASLDFPPEDES